MSSFVSNVNEIVTKLGVIEEANDIFDDGVIPILEEIAALDLNEAVEDLKKGNYLGNRKIDINLSLNMTGVTEGMNPDEAEEIWTDPTKTVLYDKMIGTFVDGTVVELPFMFDGNPVSISTHADLLTQINRYDTVDPVVQEDVIGSVIAVDSTLYRITIDGVNFDYTSDADATTPEIVSALVQEINVGETNGSVPVSAFNGGGDSLTLKADVAGTGFIASVNSNMTHTAVVENAVGGSTENVFLAKLEDTSSAGFATPVVGEIVRMYDVIGKSSNLERLQLHAVGGAYRSAEPMYYWAKTTSAFQTLSMRAGDIIKLGNELDNLILLANSVNELLSLQKRIPELVDRFVDEVAQGDTTIYNKLAELMTIHGELAKILAVYSNLDTISSVNSSMPSILSVDNNKDNITTVAADVSSVATVASEIVSVKKVSDEIVSVKSVNDNMAMLLDVEGFAGDAEAAKDATVVLASSAEASKTAAENAEVGAESARDTAIAKSDEIKGITVGSTTTAVAGSPANVTFNSTSSEFAFVIPKGDKGDIGEAFRIDANGPIADRSLYNSQAAGYAFLSMDEDPTKVYFKQSDEDEDNWSAGSPFGKGDEGEPGIGVSTITRTTGDGSAGTVDTYTITYTDAGTSTFDVTNGTANLVTSVAGRDGVVVLSKADVGLANVDNTSDSTKNSATAALTNKTITGFTNSIHADALHRKVKATVTITKGQLISYDSYNTGQNVVNVVLADKDSGEIGIGIVEEDMNAGEFGGVVSWGSLEPMDTSMYNDGEVLYMGNAGALTATRPTSGYVQPVAFVDKAHATQGALLVNVRSHTYTARQTLMDDNVTTVQDLLTSELLTGESV